MKWKNLNQNQNLLEQKNKELSEQLKKTENMKKTLSETQKNLEQNLNSLKKKNKEALSENENILNQKSKVLEKFKIKKSQEFEVSMKEEQFRLLKELAREMYKEEMNCPKELKPYLNYGEYSTVIMMEKKLWEDTERELNLLKTELGKNGIDEKWFIEKLNHIK